MASFDESEDLLVIVDDAALDVGRVRFRPEGGAGGHNGLKSISGALQSNGYARLRLGVGQKPQGMDLADWVWKAFAIAISEATLSRELKALGFSKLSARPRHHDQDPDVMDAFKKTSPPAWRRSRQTFQPGPK